MTARDYDHPIPAGNMRPVYLGDGAYASHDHSQIWISAERDNRLHAIALDASAIQMLISYAKQIGMIK